ncbi:MAG: SDR family NAD(P)-dependent oxidoreductase [Brevundimonas sp.]|nr:MAG: SDR family NAD(P)-dependent oxidoreductase [Brevundimonas sp.]
MAETVLVSGGSGGIGAAVCEALATRGFTPVVGYASNREAAQAVADRTGGVILQLDLTSDDSISAATEALATMTSPPVGVILAGSPAPEIEPFGKISPEAMALQWQVNVAGPQRLLAGVVKRCFRPRKSGTVLGVLTSALAEPGKPAAGSMGAYVIAKAGMAGLLDVLAADYGWLTVRSVRPGYTETPMLKAFDERYLEMMRERTPFSTPEQVAGEIVDELLR